MLVEFCVDTQPYTAADKAHALAMITERDPEIEDGKLPEFFSAKDYVPAGV